MKPLLIYRWRVRVAELLERHYGPILFTIVIGGIFATMVHMLMYNPAISFLDIPR